jgi:hypothetical protein
VLSELRKIKINHHRKLEQNRGQRQRGFNNPFPRQVKVPIVELSGDFVFGGIGV